MHTQPVFRPMGFERVFRPVTEGTSARGFYPPSDVALTDGPIDRVEADLTRVVG
jgi:hypothetical protein